MQLDALAHQTYAGEWEMIVVNNGSTDHSMDIVESYRDRLPNLRIVSAYIPPGPRLGVSRSYNVGLKAATGDAFLLCEADDQVAPDWLARMSEALANHAFVTGPLKHEGLNEPWLLAARDGSWPKSDGLVEPVSHYPALPCAHGCNWGMQRSVYETVGEADESYPIAWDADYSWRVQLAGIPLHYEPSAIVQYRLRHTPKALYRQGRNWGKDDPLLYARYGNKPMGLSRLLEELLRLLPSLYTGARLYLMSTFNIGRGRGGFALWCWGIGYQMGYIEGILKYALSERTIAALPQAKFYSFSPAKPQVFVTQNSINQR